MRRIATLALVVAICALLCACGSSSTSPSSPNDVLQSIVAAARAQKSVHWTLIDRPHMVYPTRWSSDVTANSGRQLVTYAPGTRWVGKTRLVLVNDTVYAKGDVVGLGATLHLPKGLAKQYADQWISIPKGDKLYAEAADGMTLASIVDDWTPHPGNGWKLKVVRKKAGGTLSVEQIGSPHWVGPTLWAHANGDPLPTAYWEGFCIGCDTSGHFSKWNEPVHVHAPASSTPIATVRGG